MKTNLEKWHLLIDELNEKSQEFIKKENIGINISDEYYHVNFFGEISKITVESFCYKHCSDALFYSGNKPTREELMRLFDYVHSDVMFDRKYITIYCSEDDADDDFIVYLNDFVVDNCYFKSFSEAKKLLKNKYIY